MPKQKLKIVYSLRVHLALQSAGFVCLTQMPNPQNNNFICWVYEESPEFIKIFDKLVKEGEIIG